MSIYVILATERSPGLSIDNKVNYAEQHNCRKSQNEAPPINKQIRHSMSMYCTDILNLIQM